MEKIVSVRHLSHRYDNHWAVRDLNFDIEGNGVVGLLGSNGAGKSTTMNIICGVLTATEGDIRIKGFNLKEHPVEARKYIGFLPQTAPLYSDLTVHEYLTHCAHLHLMDPGKVRDAVERVKERCSISHFSNRLIKSLSGGYQQRVGIAQAIVHDPAFVVLDEPTNGLDPNQIVDVRNLIREIAQESCVLLSTHILSEIQATCQEIRMIDGGKLVFSGTMDEFDNYVEPSGFIAEFTSDPSLETVKGIVPKAQVDPLGSCHYRISSKNTTEQSQIFIRQCVTQQLPLKEVTVERCSLNDVFARLSGKR